MQNSKLNKFVVPVLIILAFLFIILAIFAPYMLTSESISNRFNYTETGSIGETIGGLMSPFIALAGICITFLAFYIQLRANQIQIDSINRNQHEQTQALQRQMFFRLTEELNRKIVNFSIDNNSSYKALDELISEFRNNVENQAAALGRQLLAETPEKIPDVHYFRIAKIYYKALNYRPSEIYSKAKELKEDLIKITVFNDRWDYIKDYVGSVGAESPEKKQALEYIGSEQFYKIDFEKRKEIYKICYQKTYKKFRGFMDSYIKNFKYLINFIIEEKENSFYKDYIGSNLSNQELIFIFYYCASEEYPDNFREKIKKIDLLANLDFSVNNRFIDLPSLTEFNNEIENVLNEILTPS